MPPAEQTEMPPGSGCFSRRSTRAPASCAAMAAIPPANPNPTTMTSKASRMAGPQSTQAADEVRHHGGEDHTALLCGRQRQVAAHTGGAVVHAGRRVAGEAGRPVEHGFGLLEHMPIVHP